MIRASRISRHIAFKLNTKLDKYSVCRDAVVKDTEFDLCVIGGGSGGISCANKSYELGLKVVVLDFVSPSAHGSTWGVGGTCLNVGCIPKKLYHQAAILEQNLDLYKSYGFEVEKRSLNWNTLTANIQQYVKMSSFEIKSEMVNNNIKYLNCLGLMKDPHHIYYTPDLEQAEFIQRNNIVKDPERVGIIKSKFTVVAVGGRPVVLSEEEVPGARHMITSDDIFNLKKPPGKTLILGGGYIAIECGGFLQKLGNPTSLLVRSEILRGFDRGVVGYLRNHLVNSGLDVREGARLNSIEEDKDGGFSVVIEDTKTGEHSTEHFDTVVSAVSRRPATSLMNLERVGVKLSKDSKKIIGGFHKQREQTSVDSVFAIGDVLEDTPELTPVAIKMGMRLSHKIKDLVEGKPAKEDPVFIDFYPTTIFSYPEYSMCGMSEEAAKKEFGEESVRVFHLLATPLEFRIVEENTMKSYYKVVCRAGDGLVLGMHYLGVNAGEIMQGFYIAMRKGVTIEDLKESIGIHPTAAEQFVYTTMEKLDDEEITEEGSC